MSGSNTTRQLATSRSSPSTPKTPAFDRICGLQALYKRLVKYAGSAFLKNSHGMITISGTPIILPAYISYLLRLIPCSTGACHGLLPIRT